MPPPLLGNRFVLFFLHLPKLTAGTGRLSRSSPQQPMAGTNGSHDHWPVPIQHQSTCTGGPIPTYQHQFNFNNISLGEVWSNAKHFAAAKMLQASDDSRSFLFLPGKGVPWQWPTQRYIQCYTFMATVAETSQWKPAARMGNWSHPTFNFLLFN